MRFAALLVLILLIPICDAAVIYGKLYRWDTLDTISGAVVTIKDGSVQRMVAKNGSYSFEVAPGNYTIIAEWKDLVAVENVSVTGVSRYDLILFPKLEVSEPPEVPIIEEEEPPYYVAVAAIAGAVVAALYYIKRRETKEELPEDLKEVLEVIKRSGGRITQKELRKKLGYSEAKMSLVIADLERRGLIEKIKKGRGNIIFLK